MISIVLVFFEGAMIDRRDETAFWIFIYSENLAVDKSVSCGKRNQGNGISLNAKPDHKLQWDFSYDR